MVYCGLGGSALLPDAPQSRPANETTDKGRGSRRDKERQKAELEMVAGELGNGRLGSLLLGSIRCASRHSDPTSRVLLPSSTTPLGLLKTFAASILANRIRI